MSLSSFNRQFRKLTGESPREMRNRMRKKHTSQMCIRDRCGELRFIFQHAEETPPGGAVEVIRAGVLKGVDEVFGLHLTSTLPTGSFGVCSGVLTSATDRFEIEITGRGGHSSMPQECIDPIAVSYTHLRYWSFCRSASRTDAGCTGMPSCPSGNTRQRIIWSRRCANWKGWNSAVLHLSLIHI